MIVLIFLTENLHLFLISLLVIDAAAQNALSRRQPGMTVTHSRRTDTLAAPERLCRYRSMEVRL